MQLPFYRRITEEDLADAPDGAWKGKLLYAINLYNQQIYEGLNNNLTPEQNCLEQTKIYQIVAGATPADNTYSFTANYSYNPVIIEQYIIVADGSDPVFTTAPYVSARYVNGKINVYGVCGLTPGVRYTITLRVWWAAVINQ